ncbi:hypothetical protein WJX73_004724 [Symbiochloris irregularis]|uniref:Origin recognition complex subunit 4 n=1 Tax=Symbiochloris irregularis TaxID=706552 RepID=A0AAW1PVE2_9CHLO
MVKPASGPRRSRRSVSRPRKTADGASVKSYARAEASSSEDELAIDIEEESEPSTVRPKIKAIKAAAPSKQVQQTERRPRQSKKEAAAKRLSEVAKARDDAAPAEPMIEEQVQAPCTPPPAPQPDLTPEQLHQGWAVASAFLRSRLQDSTGSAASTMPLRPSLEKLKDSLVTKLASAIQSPGDNTSLVLIGPPGTGKSMVLERVVWEVQQRLNPNPDNPQVGVVRLSGLIHSEDRAAFQEIARQLCIAFKCHFQQAASQSENVDFLRAMLRELSKASKAVLFVLDHFDRFTGRSKQAVLYTLLDSLQTTNMQAALVGATCRLDAVELLEKRVRSRFSHEKDLVLPLAPATDTSQEAQGDMPQDVLSQLLRLPADIGVAPQYAQRFNQQVDQALADSAMQAIVRNASLKGNVTPRDLAEAAQRAIWAMPRGEYLICARHLVASFKSVDQQDSCQVAAVAGLSVLELYIVAGVQRRCRAAGVDACNFQMAWAELAPLRRQGSGCQMDVQSRPAALRAFDWLLTRNILSPLDPRALEHGAQRDFVWVRLNLTEQEIKAGALLHPSCPALLSNWLTKGSGAIRTTAEVDTD